MASNQRPFTPPYFGYMETSGGITIYRPGREVAGIVSTFDEYLAFVRLHTERARERHDEATACLARIEEFKKQPIIPSGLNIALDL